MLRHGHVKEAHTGTVADGSGYRLSHFNSRSVWEGAICARFLCRWSDYESIDCASHLSPPLLTVRDSRLPFR